MGAHGGGLAGGGPVGREPQEQQPEPHGQEAQRRAGEPEQYDGQPKRRGDASGPHGRTAERHGGEPERYGVTPARQAGQPQRLAGPSASHGAGSERPGGGSDRWTLRQEVVVALFLLFAVVVGGAIGYLAHWARQEAGAGLVDDGGVPASAVMRPGETSDVGAGATGGSSAGGPTGAALSMPGPGEEAGQQAPTDGSAEGQESAGEPTRTDGSEGSAGEVPARPRIAIVIDDWGYDWAAAPGFLSFPERLTVAVLPFLPHSVSQAERALAAGHEVIVHMPMEPLNSSLDIGPGGVYVGMEPDAVAQAVAAALAAVPGAVGMNNHMGSRATTDPTIMRTVLGVLKEQGKFFVDSFTTAQTVGPAVARDLGLPYAVNQVFLDNEDDEEHIRGQIRRLANLAKQKGFAVGIGHVRPRTYQALMDMLPELQAEGFEFVTVSQVLSFPEEVVATLAPMTVPASPGDTAPAQATTASAATSPAEGLRATRPTDAASSANTDASGAGPAPPGAAASTSDPVPTHPGAPAGATSPDADPSVSTANPSTDASSSAASMEPGTSSDASTEPDASSNAATESVVSSDAPAQANAVADPSI